MRERTGIVHATDPIHRDPHASAGSSGARIPPGLQARSFLRARNQAWVLWVTRYGTLVTHSMCEGLGRVGDARDRHAKSTKRSHAPVYTRTEKGRGRRRIAQTEPRTCIHENRERARKTSNCANEATHLYTREYMSGVHDPKSQNKARPAGQRAGFLAEAAPWSGNVGACFYFDEGLTRTETGRGSIGHGGLRDERKRTGECAR
jgi:hypothetical protein